MIIRATRMEKSDKETNKRLTENNKERVQDAGLRISHCDNFEWGNEDQKSENWNERMKQEPKEKKPLSSLWNNLIPTICTIIHYRITIIWVIENIL